MTRDFHAIFDREKPIMAMLHLKGEGERDVMERFKRELDAYVEGGVDAVIVEGYYGTYSDMVRALDYLAEQGKPLPVGVNCLHVDWVGVDMAAHYGADFLQIDSCVGHVKPRDEESLQRFFDLAHEHYEGVVLGGVRFKYQPVRSENTLEEDLAIAKRRVDAVCVTQNATGEETELSRIEAFRAGLGDFPLVIAAGATPENIAAGLRIADGAIVGSWFKDTHKDTGDVCLEYVKQFMAAVDQVRKGC